MLMRLIGGALAAIALAGCSSGAGGVADAGTDAGGTDAGGADAGSDGGVGQLPPFHVAPGDAAIA
jgi:hypothetical protein